MVVVESKRETATSWVYEIPDAASPGLIERVELRLSGPCRKCGRTDCRSLARAAIMALAVISAKLQDDGPPVDDSIRVPC